MIYNRDIRDRVARPAIPTPRLAATDVAVSGARFRELPELARLQRRAFSPGLAYGLGTLVLLWALPNVRFLVARRGDQVVGCAIGDRQSGDTRVINLAVDPDVQRRGIGTALLRALEEALPKGNVLLMVEKENTGAQALYRNEGYLPAGAANDYYGRGRHGIWMQKHRVVGPPTKLRF